MSKPRRIEVVTNDVEEQPVVQAWSTLGRNAIPSRIEFLRRRKKSVIARLVGVGTGGSDVIAKYCHRDVALVERVIYSDILPRLRLDALAYYGFVEAEDDFAWILVEDARGVELAPDDPEHRAVATRWFAALHTRSQHLDTLASLPDRGLRWYQEHLYEVVDTIRKNYGNPALNEPDRRILDRVLFRLDEIEMCWRSIEAACAGMPRTLVHGDIAERNIHIRSDGERLSLMVFDWEVAGAGIPPVDLALLDIDLYSSCVREVWGDMDLQTLCRQQALGKLLRGGIAASNWIVGYLSTPWVEKPIRNLSIYYDRMSDSMRTLGLLNGRGRNRG